MFQKNIEKEKRKQRQTWVGYYSRITPTKKDMLEREERKVKYNIKPYSES